MAVHTETTRTITVPTNRNVKAVPVFESIGVVTNTSQFNIPINVDILPGATPEQTSSLDLRFRVTSNRIPLDITSIVSDLSETFLDNILEQYIDEERELKTLVNFGDDKQSVIIANRIGPNDQTEVGTLQVKLLRPLSDDVGLGDSAFISREVANTLIETTTIRFASALDETPYLRPANTSVKLNKELGASLSNVTMQLLGIANGSIGGYTTSNNISFEDNVLRRWYSFDFNSADLNIDFSNYSNFVFYGSATMRLAAFEQKLRKIEKLTQESLQFQGSVFTGTLATAGASYILNRSAEASKEKENIIRSFDKYEQFLYFTPSGSNYPYSASANYVDNELEYNALAYYPKDINNIPYPVNSLDAQNWFDKQLGIAQRYDEFNENVLVNTIPNHVREDVNSEAYVTFIAMIGHFFDTVKPFIDQFPNIFSRNLDPNEELSKDLVIDVANSVGFPLPSLNSLYSLSDNVVGALNIIPRRDYTVETHKRLLHNLPFFVKTKGTKTALNTLLRTFGISDQLVNVREIGKSVTSSLYVFDEYSNGLNFDGVSDANVRLLLSASNRNPTSIQLNLSMVNPQTATILHSPSISLKVAQHPSIEYLGRFELTSGSTTILTSSYEEIFDDEFVSVSIRNYSTGSYTKLDVIKVDGEDIIFSSSHQETSTAIQPLWTGSQYLYIGGTGSLVATRFDGTIDEVRLWGINLTDEMVLNTAFDPGTSAGNDYTDAFDWLYVMLSFNKIDGNLLLTSSLLVNESPYSSSITPSLETILVQGIDTGSFDRYNRTVRQILPDIGYNGYVTKKIKVANAPIFLTGNDGVKELSRTQSIVPILQTRRNLQLGQNKIVISTSPSEIINQNIIRTIGLENINAVIGSPTELYKSLDSNLESLREYYSRYYHVDVDLNKYVRIVSSVSSVLNEVVDYFIPARATIHTGVVIEPNLLERIKIKPVKKIRVYGAGTRKTINAPGLLTSSSSDYGATFNLTKTIDTTDTFAQQGLYSTITKQHEDWYEAYLVSQSIKPARDVRIVAENGILQSNYAVVDRQHENWYEANLVSQSIKPSRAVRIIADNNVLEAQYNTIDSQHLDWNEYRIISNSYTPGTDEFVSQSFLPFPKTKIDMGTIDMNKVPDDTTYLLDTSFYRRNGSEPFSRAYPRKLFDFEIEYAKNGYNNGPYVNAFYEIVPSCDFYDVGTYTFFNKKTGIYVYPETRLIPKYSYPINDIWNFEQQEFATAATWSYGQQYVRGDVVRQNITTENSNLQPSIISSAKLGNNKYYVFKTDPQLGPTFDGQPWYSGSVPSYIPPSIDRQKWEVLRFAPVNVYVPKRTIFETFTVLDPSLNNFATTNISVDTIIDTPGRYIDTYRLGSLSGNGKLTGEITLQNISVLFALQLNNSNIRLRLYRTISSRQNDLNRPISEMPTEGSGLLLDAIISNANITELTNPIPSLVADGEPPFAKLYYTIDNLDVTGKLDITMLLYYFAIELESRVPFGYLRKHYRFFRDNATATKRRNFEGCKNTDDTTIDGLPVVEISLTEGTQTTVAPTKKTKPIKTGGGGIFNVNGTSREVK